MLAGTLRWTTQGLSHKAGHQFVGFQSEGEVLSLKTHLLSRGVGWSGGSVAVGLTLHLLGFLEQGGWGLLPGFLTSVDVSLN